jgi:hypothetical protein
MHPGHGILAPDYVRIPSHGGLAGKLGLPPPPWPVNGCFLLRGAGVVFAIDVPYEAAVRYASDFEHDNVVLLPGFFQRKGTRVVKVCLFFKLENNGEECLELLRCFFFRLIGSRLFAQ